MNLSVYSALMLGHALFSTSIRGSLLDTVDPTNTLILPNIELGSGTHTVFCDWQSTGSEAVIEVRRAEGGKLLSATVEKWSGPKDFEKTFTTTAAEKVTISCKVLGDDDALLGTTLAVVSGEKPGIRRVMSGGGLNICRTTNKPLFRAEDNPTLISSGKTKLWYNVDEDGNPSTVKVTVARATHEAITPFWSKNLGFQTSGSRFYEWSLTNQTGRLATPGEYQIYWEVVPQSKSYRLCLAHFARLK